MTSVGLLLRLETLVPPPDYPVRGDGDWKRFWSVNGFQPPEGYRMLIREYGTGTFAGWLRLIEPFHPSRSFIELVEAECRVLRAAQASPGWPVWPEPGGFLPWATTTAGDRVGWRTDRRPDDWTTVIWTTAGCAEFEVDAIGFLVGVAEGTLTVPCSDGAGNPFERGGPAFEPAAE